MTQKIVSDASALSEGDHLQECQQQQQKQQPSKNPIWEAFDQQAAASTSRPSSLLAHTELEQYFKMAVIPRTENPLQWWKVNGHVFPSIQAVAKLYLSTLATSIPSERLFSKAGELISAKRNRLKDKNINMMLFLNKCPL